MAIHKSKILFYLEPVTFQNEPYRLWTWHQLFSDLARQSADQYECVLAASSAMASLPDHGFSEVLTVDPISILASAGFDRARYSRDLTFGSGRANSGLADQLDTLKTSVNPDIVVCVTDNRYLKRAFGASSVMHAEVGPLPPTGLKTMLYVDPFGHQTNSAVDRLSSDNWLGDRFADFKDAWELGWLAKRRGEAEASGFASWLEASAWGRRVALMVMQPQDWVTYEGGGVRLDPLSLLRRTTFNVAEGWCVLPQWHPADPPPLERLATDLSGHQSAMIMPLPQHRVGCSDMALPLVDSVVTVSSNVAAAALISGISVQFLGRSKFSKLALRFEGNPQPLPGLLAFLTCRYCVPLDDMRTLPGAFAAHVTRLKDDANFLFDTSEAKLDRFQDLLT
ncbi:hypothetical protein BH10PSE1_BH10PSE1_11240 [soil metagenome]